MNELISVIVPVYKVEKYLKRCLDSIISQTYKNLEIILVDDGSPDSSGDICDEFACLDKRIKVIHKKNGGLSDARNKGIDVASGEYITFLDSDDWIDLNYVKKLYDLLKITNSDISVCDYIPTNYEDIALNNEQNSSTLVYSNYEALESLFSVHSIAMVVSWGKLYKANLFEGIRFPIGRIHEDEFITYKILYKAKKVAFTSEKLIYYWQHNESITNSGFRLQNKLDLLEAILERTEFFGKINRRDLSNKSLRVAFSIYRLIYQNKEMFKSEQNKRDFLANYKKFRHELRNSNQSFVYRVYYETCYILPLLISVLDKLRAFISNKLRASLY